jgi:hypothetical protein
MPERPSLCCGKWIRQDLWLETRVQTRSSRLELGRVENGRLKLRLTAPPADGKANEQARRCWLNLLGLVFHECVIHGQTHKDKRFLIQEPSRYPPEVFKI